MFYADYGGGLSAYAHGGCHPAGSNKGEVNIVIITYSNGITIGVALNFVRRSHQPCTGRLIGDASLHDREAAGSK